MALKFRIQKILHNKLYIKSNKTRTEIGIGGIDEASQAIKELIEEEV